MPNFPYRAGGLTAALCLTLAARPAGADILITEVIPNVTTTATAGDIVELYNTGPNPVDLTDWILTDLDNDPVAGVLQDASFAPGTIPLAPLGAGEFAVIDFVDAAGTASWTATNYGLRIVAPLEAGSFLGSERDELVLADGTHTLVDSVAWADSGTVVSADSYEDLTALTGAVFDYGLIPGGAAWAGPETIVSDADYYASAVDFTAYAAVSSYRDGAVRRRSTGGVFDLASPDGAAQWEAVPRHQATLGNASDDVATAGGLRPLRITGDLATWLGQIETTTFPDRRLARFADQNPADFVAASGPEQADWQALFALAMNAEWEEAFSAADPLGYEVVEFFDTVSGETFHLLRERFVPGEVDFTGRGTFAFFEGTGVQTDLVIEIPHPVFDSGTLEQGALALVQVRPRVLSIAGTHRNKALAETTCDGSFSGGAKYRISDVAHHPDNFLHAAHRWLESDVTGLRTVQSHGFCCPGVAPYDTLTDDCVVSNGVDALPGPADFAQVWRSRIDAQNFLADGIDLTTAAVFGDDTPVLGATTNVQGRVSNSVAQGAECNTDAVAAAGRFFHLEQDPDVREEPLHILTALLEALATADDIPSPLRRNSGRRLSRSRRRRCERRPGRQGRLRCGPLQMEMEEGRRVDARRFLGRRLGDVRLPGLPLRRVRRQAAPDRLGRIVRRGLRRQALLEKPRYQGLRLRGQAGFERGDHGADTQEWRRRQSPDPGEGRGREPGFRCAAVDDARRRPASRRRRRYRAVLADDIHEHAAQERREQVQGEAVTA